LKKWVLVGKFRNKFYFIIIIVFFLCSSFGPSKKDVHVNGNGDIGEDLLLKKQLKDDVDF